MKHKLLSTLICILTFGGLFAQAPEGFNYQAVIKNSSGQAVANQSVSLRFTIRDGSASGTIVYRETQTKTTSAAGLVSTVVGKGTLVSGAYPSTSVFAGTTLFFQVEVDPAGGSSYTDLGAIQIVSVPFANYANGASSASTATTATTATTANALSSSATITPSQITAGGASSNQYLKWNGTAWTPATVAESPWIKSSNDIYYNTGNVGIGTSSPASPFHLKGNGSIGRMEFASTSSYGDWFSFYNKSRYIGYLGNYNDTSGLDFGTSGTGTKVSLVTGAVPRLTINTSGNVGIGTTSPNTLVDMYSSNQTAILNIKTGNATLSSKLVASNSSGNTLELAKWGTSASGTTNGWSNASMGSLTNDVGSLLINAGDSIALGTNGKNNLLVKKSGEVMINGTSSASNAGYLYIAYPNYNSIKPAFEMNGSNVWMGFRDGSTYKSYIQQNADLLLISCMTGDLALRSYNTTQMTFKKTTIGLHTSAPKADLHIDGSSNSNRAGLYVTNAASAPSFSSGDTGTLSVYNSYTGSNYAYALTAKINSNAGYGAYFNAKYCGLRVDVQGGSSLNGYGGYFTAANSSTSNYGATGIGNGTSSTNYGVYGSASGGTTNYSVYCAGNGVYTGTWTSSSDARLKENVTNLGSSLEMVMKLRPTAYNFKTNDPRYKSMNLSTGTHFGFIAQELETVYPSLVMNNVHTDPKNPSEKIDYKSVNYTELIPVLVKAIQEQQAQIEELKKQLAAKN